MVSVRKSCPAKRCTGLPTAWFFGGSAPTKALVGEMCLADPAAGERWALGGIRHQSNCFLWRWKTHIPVLEKPDLQDENIIACLQDEYGLLVVQIAFLPLGADLNTAVYRVVADDETSYFLKLRI